ncbi:MAG: hypothetical protein ACRC6B_00840 [Fusobacteriaceae bacterium]
MFTTLAILSVGFLGFALIMLAEHLEKKEVYNEEKSELYKKALKTRKSIIHEESYNEYFGIKGDK